QGGVVGAHGLGQVPGESEADVAVLGVDHERLDVGGGDGGGGLEGGGDRVAGGPVAGGPVAGGRGAGGRGRAGRGGPSVGDHDDDRAAVGVAVAGGAGDVESGPEPGGQRCPPAGGEVHEAGPGDLDAPRR